ncbi:MULTISPECIES: YeeE/YedE thiosulfate transporter family protein [Sulfurimonas]|uniref:YeeE/YedE thiosulfate transporter family protein n=1 Tax=Sulfurimonas TaxID=202746 RepID=UPI0012636922|nr:YeeE/YedE thiosulfate transporter family protein [Sulfurimonas indica]
MFDIIAKEEHGSILTILVIGFFFGAIILYSRLDKFEKMAGFLLFEDTLAIRMAMTTVGLSSIGFYFLVANGYASFDVKPTLLGGLIIGAVLFGTGLVILGKCPAAFFVSVSEGRIDALVGVIGGMVGGAVFTYFYPYIQKIMEPNFGKIRLPDFFTEYGMVITVVFGVLLLVGAYLLPSLEYKDPADFKNSKD